MYIYESHLGNLYVNEKDLDYEDLYCGRCGDYDILIGYALNKNEAFKLLKDTDWDQNYVKKFINENFEY